jgi:hypothetical protein
MPAPLVLKTRSVGERTPLDFEPLGVASAQFEKNRAPKAPTLCLLLQAQNRLK